MNKNIAANMYELFLPLKFIEIFLLIYTVKYLEFQGFN